MKQSLKHSVQQHLNKKSLSSKQLNQLLASQEKHLKQSNKPYFSWYKMATAASILMVSVILSLYLANTAYFSTQPIALRIAEEVAGNHLKLKPLEISSNTMEGIKTYFNQLNFSPVTPSSLKLSKQNLLGGRYCSIQGLTALQLRMMNNKTNKVQSLYETEYDKKVFKDFPKLEQGSKPVTVYVKGMKVDIWVEKDILFALIE